MDCEIIETDVIMILVGRIVELERQRYWLAERLHRKGTISYDKYPPTTEGWIKAAERAIEDFGI